MPPGFPLSIRLTVLWILSHPLSCPYVAITLCGPSFQKILVPKSGLKESPQHHISNGSHRQIQFALCRVQSLLLAASQLISFPAVTKTFQFTAFAALSGSRLKSH